MLTPRTLGPLSIPALAVVFVLALGAARSPAQLIEVLGNNVRITAGDLTPSLNDHTDFGSVDVAAGVVDRTFTIRNGAEAPLRLFGLQRLGGASGEFTIIPPQPAIFILSGETTTFTVRFNPAQPQSRQTTIRIQSNASNHAVFDFAIKGFGRVPTPDINVQGNGLNISNGDPLPRLADHTDFGSIDVMSGPLTRTFTIQNLGDLRLDLRSIEFFGGNSSGFTISAVSGFILPPTTQVTLDISFDPATTGPHQTTVRISNTDPDEDPYDFAIRGEGTTLASELTLLGNGRVILNGDDTPSFEDHTRFENTKLGAGRSMRQFTIKNTGNAELIIAELRTLGAHAADFALEEIPSAPIPPGGSQNFRISFLPAAFGLRTAKLRLSSNDPNTPVYEVTLLGAGGQFELLGVERDGKDVVITFHTNPDPNVSTYIYNILHSTDLEHWNGIHSFSTKGGTTEVYRVINGAAGEVGYWRVREVTIP